MQLVGDCGLCCVSLPLDILHKSEVIKLGNALPEAMSPVSCYATQFQYSTIINIINRLHGGEVSKLSWIQLSFFQISGLDSMYECLPGHRNIENSFVGQRQQSLMIRKQNIFCGNYQSRYKIVK